jgi:hypothetical protein
VSAIFYVDTGGKGPQLPTDALRILAEFAGAQLDRLMALSGGLPPEAVIAKVTEEEVISSEPVESTVAAEAEPALSEPAVEVREPEGESSAALPEIEAPSPAPEVEVFPAAETPAPAVVAEEENPVESSAIVEVPIPEPLSLGEAPEPEPVAAPVEEAVLPAAAPDLAKSEEPQRSEVDEKIHRDARRFARLLVSEIELYNKTKVADGRKNGDIYKRLKSDIVRSRHTYEKRFGKTLPKQFDYFHEELVRSLASNDSSLLGTDYPGPAA